MERTLVIVDDSGFMADMLGHFFEEKLGFHVIATGTDGGQAVELYQRHRPTLITVDLTMPVKDGVTALKEILSEFPEAKVLLVTAHKGPQVVECMKLGAAGFVEKPLLFDDPQYVEEFINTVTNALGE